MTENLQTKEDIIAKLTDGPGYDHQKQNADVALIEAQFSCTSRIAAAFKSLEESMTRNAKSSERLSRVVCWLNGILAVGTVVGAVAAVLMYFK